MCKNLRWISSAIAPALVVEGSHKTLLYSKIGPTRMYYKDFKNITLFVYTSSFDVRRTKIAEFTNRENIKRYKIAP